MILGRLQMAGPLFFMAQLPPYLEQLIHQGKAVAKSLSMAACQQLVIPVPTNTYIVVYGYDYLPMAPNLLLTAPIIADYLVQYVVFVNNGNFYPFSHALAYNDTTIEDQSETVTGRAHGHDQRQTYIVAKSDLSVYFTKLATPTLLTLTSNVLNAEGPIFANSGYAGVNTVTTVQEYNDNGAGRVNPLTDKYTVPQYTPNPARYNQAYTIPQNGGALDMTLLLPATGAAAKARANHINLYYVEINQQAPPNII